MCQHCQIIINCEKEALLTNNNKIENEDLT